MQMCMQRLLRAWPCWQHCWVGQLVLFPLYTLISLRHGKHEQRELCHTEQCVVTLMVFSKFSLCQAMVPPVCIPTVDSLSLGSSSSSRSTSVITSHSQEIHLPQNLSDWEQNGLKDNSGTLQVKDPDLLHLLSSRVGSF